MLEQPWSMQDWLLMGSAGVSLLLLGYVLGLLLQGRKQAQLNAQRQEGQLRESSLQQQLEFSRQGEQRLQDELDQATDEAAQWLGRLRQVEKSFEAVQAEKQAQQAYLTEYRQRLQQHEREYTRLLEDKQQLDSQHVALKTSMERKQEHFQEQLQQLQENRQLLSKEFESLANKIFTEKSQNFVQASQNSLDALLKPFQQQIEGFQKRINEVHDASLQGNTQLGAEIKKVLDTGMQMSREAGDLTRALKGDAQQRGAWGEAQLRRTLELSGLLEGAHFDVQSSFRDEQGRHKQTDYLIRLPGDKHLVIDSKVALNAYLRLAGGETEAEQQQALAEHLRAVRKHMDDLASKDYSRLSAIDSPEFVLMFMPVEPAYIEALKHDPELFEYGYNKGVILVSHTTLIPVLRTVANLWMTERSSAQARELGQRAAEVYNQVCLLAERLGKLGQSLGAVSNHYNSTVTALAGQQGLYGKVERFNQVSAKANKNLPALEPTHMDFQTERLQLVVEPMDEAQPSE